MIEDCPHLPNVRNYIKKGQPSSQPAVLTNPFLAPQQMVAQAPIPPSRGASSSSATILMIDVVIGLSMLEKNYDQLEGRPTTNDTLSTSQPDSSLTLERPTFELPSCPSNVKYHWTMHTFNTRTAQYYSIVEDLA